MLQPRAETPLPDTLSADQAAVDAVVAFGSCAQVVSAADPSSEARWDGYPRNRWRRRGRHQPGASDAWALRRQEAAGPPDHPAGSAAKEPFCRRNPADDPAVRVLPADDSMAGRPYWPPSAPWYHGRGPTNPAMLSPQSGPTAPRSSLNVVIRLHPVSSRRMYLLASLRWGSLQPPRSWPGPSIRPCCQARPSSAAALNRVASPVDRDRNGWRRASKPRSAGIGATPPGLSAPAHPRGDARTPRFDDPLISSKRRRIATSQLRRVGVAE